MNLEHDMRRKRPAFCRAGLLGLMGLTLIGCQELAADRSVEETATVGKLSSPDPEAMAAMLEEIGIPVAGDLFMIPAGLDEEGCETFNPHSAGNPVKAALHYRQADGTFGIARDPAVCAVEMTAIGPDEDGCERYRAVPVNSDLPVQHEVVYYRTAEGTYSARKPEGSCG